MSKPPDISYDDTALIVAGERFPCDNPRLAFARKLAEFDSFSGTNTVGEGNVISQDAVIGYQGFGFERDENGVPVRIPHFGGVLMGDHVEVGACTVIVRGTIGNTVLGDHVKLDDHVFVAHNVQIGDCTLVVAGAVICGSAKIGKRCWIGAGAIIREHVTVGDDAFVGMGAVVVKDVPAGVTVIGNPAREMQR